MGEYSLIAVNKVQAASFRANLEADSLPAPGEGLSVQTSGWKGKDGLTCCLWKLLGHSFLSCLQQPLGFRVGFQSRAKPLGKAVQSGYREPAALMEAIYSSFLGISGHMNRSCLLLVLSCLIHFTENFIHCPWDDHFNSRGYERNHYNEQYGDNMSSLE